MEMAQVTARAMVEMDLAILADCAVPPAAICVGMAGADRAEAAQTVADLMQRLGRGSRILVVNDALIALVAGAGQQTGIVIISGTGAIVYGRTQDGRAARSGGWGYLIGDEGSAYWMGLRALAAVVRAADGRGPATALTDGVLAHFGVDSPGALVPSLYGATVPRTQIAMLGPAIHAACAMNDVVANAIVDAAGDELCTGAEAVTRRLGLRDEAFAFVLSGGVFRAVPRLVTAIAPCLAAIAPNASVTQLTEEPARGAVALALAEARGGATIPRYEA